MAAGLLELGVSFRLHLQAEGKARNTIKTYLESVRFFSAWLTEQGRPATTDELTRPRIREWLANLSATFEPSTVLVRWSGLHRFCGWLLEEGELDGEHPMKTIAKPDVSAKLVPVLADDDLTALIKACAGRTFYDRRDEAIIRTLLDCGLRVSELCGMTTEGAGAVDLDAACCLVTGKGGKQRMVYWGSRTGRALDRYKRMRARHRWAHLGAFWLGERGALTTDGVRQRMEVRAGRAGLIDPANPHRFRHTVAHDFLLAGGDRGDLKRLMGWTSDVMLERYGASGADLRAREAVRKLRRGDRV